MACLVFLRCRNHLRIWIFCEKTFPSGCSKEHRSVDRKLEPSCEDVANRFLYKDGGILNLDLCDFVNVVAEDIEIPRKTPVKPPITMGFGAA